MMRYLYILIVLFFSSQENTDKKIFYSGKISGLLDTTSISIGEQATYELRLSLDSISLVKFPEKKDFLPIEVVEIFDTDTIISPFTLIKKYKLTQFDSGTYYVPKQKFTIRNKVFETDSIKLIVNNVVVDTTKQELFDIKPIIEANTSFGTWIWNFLHNYKIIILFFVLSIILAFIFFFRNRIIIFFKPSSKKINYLSAYERAKEELYKIEELSYSSQSEIKIYYSKLTYIIREFLNKKVIDDALESTTEELILKLEKLKKQKGFNFETSTLKKLKEVFLRADLVKFAKYKPDLNTAIADKEIFVIEIDNIKNILPEPNEKELLENLKYQQELQISKIKKRNKRFFLTSFSIIILCFILSSFLFGFNNIKDHILRNPNLILNNSENWVQSEYGSPGVIINTPKVLTRNLKQPYFQYDDSEIVSEFSDYLKSSKLNIIISNIKFNNNPSSEKLQEIVIYSIENFEDKGVENILTQYEKFNTPNGAEGIKVFGKGDFPNEDSIDKERLNYEIIGFINKEGFKQITLIWSETDKYIKEIIDRIIKSIELIKK